MLLLVGVGTAFAAEEGETVAAVRRDGEFFIETSTPITPGINRMQQTVRLADNGQFVVGFMGRYEDVLVKVRWSLVDQVAQARVVHSAGSDSGG